LKIPKSQAPNSKPSKVGIWNLKIGISKILRNV